MIVPPATLPIVIIFEQHCDKITKQLIKDSIPELSAEGYDTLCFEAPQDLSEQEIISSVKANLEFDDDIHSQAKQCLERAHISCLDLADLEFKKLVPLIRNYVSSKKYLEVAEKIKTLPASKLMRDILNDAKRLYLRIKGVDINADEFSTLASCNPSKRMGRIEKIENFRIQTIVRNLLQLHNEGKELIFICGAIHAENLMRAFEEKRLHDRVLYYAPHSDNTSDEVKEIFSNDTLKDHAFCLLNEFDRLSLIHRIIQDIKSKNTQFIEEIDKNCHSVFLSDFFKKDFRALMRPGYYVDALLDITESDATEVVNKLQRVSVETSLTSLFGRTYLVVSEVNTKEVADRIRKLK